MESPYAPPLNPEHDRSELDRKIRFWRGARWFSVALVVLPPLFGLSGTVLGMFLAFGELAADRNADPEALAGGISIALLTTLFGLLFCVLGLIALVVSLLRIRTYRRLLNDHAKV